MTRCPTCHGTGVLEFCPKRSDWCANLGFCRTCFGTGQVESAKDVVRRIVQRHTPVEQEEAQV